eukprot:249417-Prymnesium_polylepis.1
MIGGIRPEYAMELSRTAFRGLGFSALRCEDLRWARQHTGRVDGTLCPLPHLSRPNLPFTSFSLSLCTLLHSGDTLAAHSTLVDFGSVDAFISHAWAVRCMRSNPQAQHAATRSCSVRAVRRMTMSCDGPH